MRIWTLNLCLLPVVAAGCWQPDKPTIEECRRGTLVMIPGVEGSAWQFAQTYEGLRAAGCDQRIEVIEWGVRPLGSLINLCTLETNRRRAKVIAERIQTLQREHPDRPITLLGFSGGAGLAVLIAEFLPSEVMLDRLVLVGAALSFQYDLSTAAGHAKLGVLSYFSPRDVLTLGWGTKTFGNIDRIFGPSAGRVGFQTAEGVVIQTATLEQVAWSPQWRQLGHHGGHLGWLSRDWARVVLGPRLKLEVPCPMVPQDDGMQVMGMTGTHVVPIRMVHAGPMETAASR
jgi:pimeloyl-ACP methyl ester carboxylesterase